MAVHTYRELKPTPEAEAIYRRWLAQLNEDFTRHKSVDRRSEIVRDELYQMYLGRSHGGRVHAALTTELASNVLAESFDPRNATLEPEYYGDVNAQEYAIRKPLIWFWQMFDRSPLGLNHWLGLRFRAMLGRHIFEHVGTGVKIHQGVDFTYGYNLKIGDCATIRQRALLNDRGGIEIGHHAMIGSYARVYSITHAPDDFEAVTLVPTSIGAGARIGSHAIVRAGEHVAPGQVFGNFPLGRL